MTNQLYEFTMKVLRGEGCDLPENMKGAHVTCYVAAPDFLTAVKNGVVAMKGMHYVVQEVQERVREIPLTRWSEYVGKVWPEFADHFPKQEELPSLVDKGVVFFGPFTGW